MRSISRLIPAVFESSGRAFAADRGEERGAEVAVAAVGEDHDNGAFLELLSHAQGTVHGSAAAHADKQSFLDRKLPRGLKASSSFTLIFSSRVSGV